MDTETREPARIGAGDVPVVIDGVEYVLKPSYHAARTISTQSGGIAGAIERVVRLDIETIISVLSLGLGYSQGNRQPKDFPDRVWRTGFTDDTGGLAERCVLYLRVLAAGGRMPKTDTEGGEGGDPVDPR